MNNNNIMFNSTVNINASGEASGEALAEWSLEGVVCQWLRTK